MTDLAELIVADLEWRSTLEPDVLEVVRRTLDATAGNLVEQLLMLGVGLTETMAVVSAVSGLPVAPSHKVGTPEWTGLDPGRFRSLRAVPIGRRLGLLCVAFADPVTATGDDAQELGEHQAFLAAPYDVDAALGSGSVDATRRMKTGELSGVRRAVVSAEPRALSLTDFSDEDADTFHGETARSHLAPAHDVTLEGAREGIHSAVTEDPSLAAKPRQPVRPAPPRISSDPLFEATIDINQEFGGDTLLVSHADSSWESATPQRDRAPPSASKGEGEGLDGNTDSSDPAPFDSVMVTAEARSRSLSEEQSSRLLEALEDATIDLSQRPRPVTGLSDGAGGSTGFEGEHTLSEPGEVNTLIPLEVDAGSVIGRSAVITSLLGHHAASPKPVMINQLAAHLAYDNDVREAFISGARVSAGLKHRHILATHEVGELDGLPTMVVEHATGGSLAALKAQLGRLPVALALSLMDQALDALGFAHDRGVVHRDLRPDNLLLTEDGLRVAEFGLSVNVLDLASTRSGRFLGSPAYLSPEFIEDRDPTPASDLYSLAVIFYELIAGQNPFVSTTAVDTIRRIREMRVPPLLVAEPTVPPGVDALFARLLARDPSKRPGSAAEVREAFKPILDVVDPKRSLPGEVIADPRGLDESLRAEQAEAERSRAAAALRATPPRPVEAAFRMLKATMLLPVDERLVDVRNVVFAEQGWRTPRDGRAEHARLIQDLPQEEPAGFPKRAGRCLDAGDLLGALVRIRWWLEVRAHDADAQRLLRALIGDAELGPFVDVKPRPLNNPFAKKDRARRRKRPS